MGLFSRRSTDWSLAKVDPPWQGQPSIYAHLRQHVVPGQRGLAEGGETLPDEARVSEAGGLRWVAGGQDGAFGHHGSGGQGKAQAKQVARALEVVLEDASSRKVSKLYQLLLQGSALEYVDELLGQLSDTLNLGRLRTLAEWVARGAPDREPVKVSVALLGAVAGGSDEVRELLMTLGRHEELTLYVAVALSNAYPDHERDLLELAQHVEGWGRIQLVERLAKTESLEIKRWLLREGFRNSIMNEYLAYTCATAGGLLAELSAATVDEALLAGAGDIIRALIAGGPAESMEHYADGAAVVEKYLDHLGPEPRALGQLIVVDAIGGYLGRVAGDPAAEARGWTRERSARAIARCQIIRALLHWPDLVAARLASEDHRVFWEADQAARVLGIDTWDQHYERLASGRSDDWYHVMQTEDSARIDRILELAEQCIALEKIAVGPGTELGLGPEWTPHGHLDFVLQELPRFPGRGWPLIRAGLRSPVIRNRHMALRALSPWAREDWSAETEPLLQAALAAEPDGEVRRAIEAVLAGRPIEDNDD